MNTHTVSQILARSTPLPYVGRGIYFLIKKDTVVYVGQSSNMLVRIAQHLPEKDFDSVAIQPIPETWTQTDLDALEAKYISSLSVVQCHNAAQ